MTDATAQQPTSEEIREAIRVVEDPEIGISVVDLGLVNQTTTGLSKGLGWGLVNLSDADFTGIQLGTVNVVGGNFEGFEWGFVNHAQNVKGLQLGFINYAQTMYGLQIGLVNIIKQDGFMPFFPFVTWSF